MKTQCPFCEKLFTDDDSLRTHVVNQHPSNQGGPREDDLDHLARVALFAFLRSDGKDPGLLAKAKQANAYRSTEARREQTQGAREATLVMMARELAEDKKQFRKFIRLALPHSPMLRIADKSEEGEKAS